MMKGLNDVLDYQVITPRGARWVRELNPGDEVIEYGTGKTLEFRSQELKKPTDVYQITYSDDRSMLVNWNDEIYMGGKRIERPGWWLKHPTLCGLICREPIEHKPVQFRGFEHYQPEIPDPYVTGALWFASDWTDPDMNTSLTMTDANQVLRNKYNIEYVDRIRKGKVYYRYIDSDHILSWGDFFKTLDWYPVTKMKTSDIIPRQIEFGDMKTRKQFLRGIFDVGYQINGGDGHLYLEHPSEKRLRALQRMMWGLGIISIIRMCKQNGPHDPCKYRLSVIDDKWRYPGFLYHTQKIEQQIIYERQLAMAGELRLLIRSIRRPESPVPIDRGVVPNVRLNKPRALFYDGNYLPRVSL